MRKYVFAADIPNRLYGRFSVRLHMGVFLALMGACLSAWQVQAHEHPAPKPAANQETEQPALASPEKAGHVHAGVQTPSAAEPQSAPHSHAESQAMETAPHLHPEGEGVTGMGATGDHEHMAMDPEQADDSQGHAHVASTPARSLVLSLVAATLIVAAALVLFARRSLRRSGAAGVISSDNLLDHRMIGSILRSRFFLLLLIAPTLLVFAFIVVAGLWGEQNTGNPALLLTWILWWPAVIFTFFILGRIWCAVCPFGYLGDLAQKIFSLRLKVPSFLRNMWWRLAFFIALTWGTTLWALDRWPKATAWLALAEAIGAILLAVIFEKRAFCRFVCPVGGVFGLYSMTAPVRLGVRDSNVCHQKCPEKQCYTACSWFQYPPTVDRNAECTLCMDCVRACPHDNITLHAQSFGADLMHFQSRRNSLDEAVAVAVVLGIALLQTVVMLNRWGNWQESAGRILHIAPGRLLYTVLFISLGVIAPVLVVSFVAFLTRSAENSREGFFRAFRTYAFSFLPLGLALHAAHNFHHLFGEGGAMWTGLKNAVAQYAGWAVSVSGADPAADPGPNTLFFMQWVALLAGLYLAGRVGVALVRRNGLPPQRAFRAAVPILLFATAFTVLNLVVLSAAMSHRH